VQHETLSALVGLLGNQDALGTRAKVIEQEKDFLAQQQDLGVT